MREPMPSTTSAERKNSRHDNCALPIVQRMQKLCASAVLVRLDQTERKTGPESRQSLVHVGQQLPEGSFWPSFPCANTNIVSRLMQHVVQPISSNQSPNRRQPTRMAYEFKKCHDTAA